MLVWFSFLSARHKIPELRNKVLTDLASDLNFENSNYLEKQTKQFSSFEFLAQVEWSVFVTYDSDLASIFRPKYFLFTR